MSPTLVSITCRHCQCVVMRPLSHRRSGFCSRKCYHEWTRGNHPRRKRVEITCVECGALTMIKPCLKGIRKYCSRKCMHLGLQKITGPAHGNWDGGKTPPQKQRRSSSAAQLWRLSVLERDGHKCVKCGATERLHVHHIESYTHHPELRRDLNNGLTLCKSCHYAEHSGKPRARRAAQ